MKRLTFEGNFCDIATCSEVRGGTFCEDGACSQRKTWERLKAIEDILGDDYELDRLREPIIDGTTCIGARNIDLSFMPSIDLVRCGECTFYNKPRLGWCSFHMDRENADDFCSYGKRKGGSNAER